MNKEQLSIVQVSTNELTNATYNPRKHNSDQANQLKESIKRFGMVDPIICNAAPERKNIVIGGHFRLKVAKEMGIETVPVVYVNIPDLEKEKELNLRLNKNTGEFDTDLLAEFDESFLTSVGFSSEDLDDVFAKDDVPETFDMKKELEKIGIKEILVEKGDVYEIDGSRVMCGDSTIETDVLKLMGSEKADMCMTDPPYILDYLHGKKKKGGKATQGFGLKRDRQYLGTDSLPDNFTDLWMANIAKVQKPDFSIMVFENPKNLRTIWNVLEQHWRYRGTVIWHVPNRVQGFSAKYKFFNKSDIALVGTSDEKELNLEEEEPLLQEEYETALYATSGEPHWEGYEKGKKICPTDFIEHIAADEKSSGQGIIFGTKPLPILIPYIKVLTLRGDLVVEPFGGSGSTLIASLKLARRCFLMEKSPVYAQVILKRWENETGKVPKKLND